MQTGLARHSADIVFWSLTMLFGTWMILRYWDSWYLWMDDWTLLGTRLQVLQDDGYAAFFLRRHNEHLMAGMVLWNAALGKMFGLRSYLPWVVTVVLANVSVAWIVRAYMTRLGTTRLVASVCAPFVLIWASFGSVSYWAPESIFIITTALAMAHLLLAEHDGPANRRDALGVVAGLSAVFIHSSAVIVLIPVVGILLWRQRWGASLIASIPCATGGLWFITYGRGVQVWNFSAHPESVPVPALPRDPETMVRFMGSTLSKVATGSPSLIAGLLVIFLVTYGTAVAVRQGRGRLACYPIVGTLLYLSAVAWSRASFSAFLGMEPASRYVAVVALLVSPILVLAAQELVGRFMPAASWQTAFVGVAVFVVVLGFQVRGRNDQDREILPYGLGTRGAIFDLVDGGDLEQMDGDALVFDTAFMDLTVDGVRRLVRMGWFDTDG